MNEITTNNTCICYPNKNVYSETFIRDQIDYIKPELELYEGWLPNQIIPSGSIYPFPFNILLVRGLLRNILPSVYKHIYDFFLLKMFKKKRIKYVLGNYGPIGSRLAELCKKNDIRFIVHFHGFDAHDKKTLDTFKEDYHKIFKNALEIVCVSVDMQNQLISLGAKKERLHLIPYGVNTVFFEGAKPSSASSQFLFVGRFVEKKSPLELIRAFKLAHTKHPDSVLIMVGHGPLLEASKEEVKKLQLTSNVQFVGIKSREEIKKYMLESRAYVQHSVTSPNGDCEGTPLVILEASSACLPIISTRHTGIKQAVIHEKTGYLVDEHDIKGMADYMIKVIENPLLADELGKEARKHILINYETEKQKQKLLQLLKMK